MHNRNDKFISMLQVVQQYQFNMFDFFSHHTLLEGDYNLKDIKIEEELGRGNSHVFTAQIKGQMYALKQIQIKNDYQYQNFLKQVTFMKQLSNQSQCMVKYQGYFITKMEVNQYLKYKYAFIIMQCAQMNLENLVIEYKLKKKRFKINQIQNFIQYVLNALCSLQEKDIAHCDIKPENILIMDSTSFMLKLCDVGSCKIVTGQNRQQATILGTVPFLAPQLIKIKSTKIVSSNPFKSDVFSFGLVFLYLITFKKFKSLQRLETQEAAYKQIILEWIRQAKQLVNYDSPLSQLFRLSLEFDSFKRPLFKQLKAHYFVQKKKKYSNKQKQLEDLQKQEEDKLFTNKAQLSTTYFQSVPSNHISLFKSRKFQKPSIKTGSNGSTFRITTTSNSNNNPFKIAKQRNYSPSPLTKRKNSFQSQLNSPLKLSNNWSFIDIKKVVFINQKSKQLLPVQIIEQDEKIFVLQIPFVPFKKAQTITILSTCGLQVFYQLEGVQAKRLYLQYEGVDGIGLAQDAPTLKLSKIRINLIKSSLVGGYQGLFKIIPNPLLQILQLRLNQSEVQFKQVIVLIDSLISQCPKLSNLVFCWQKNILTQDEHFQLTQKISKLPLKKLMMIMNQNYIKYDKQMTWLLPKSCQILYLDYGHNLLNSIINNLSLSIGSNQNLKQLYFNFENNNLLKGEMNMVIKAIAELKNLQKLILDMSYNKIQDLNYLQKNISELVNLTVIEIRLHKTETSIQRTIQFMKSLVQLFQWKLKILKVTTNRIINLKILQQKVNRQCTMASKRVSSQVIGFDNNYFMIYLKKKSKPTGRTVVKGATSAKKDLKTIGNFGMTTMTTLNSNTTTLSTTTTSNFRTKNSTITKNVNGVCTRFYTMSQGFDNYMCLGCCQTKQSAKNTYYCKFCIQHCFHKGHNIVKVYCRTKCSCSHSGHCTSQISQNECAQVLGIDYKKQYDCLKCKLSLCISCISSCQQSHSTWVRQVKQANYFTCSTTNTTNKQ